MQRGADFDEQHMVLDGGAAHRRTGCGKIESMAIFYRTRFGERSMS
jgi:hypothetical protein